MYRTCRAPDCRERAASRFAAYCHAHRTALRRHGAPDQKAITAAQLKPYLKLVKARVAKNPENIAWVTLDERWRALVDHAEGVLADYARGRANSRFERAAACEVVKLAADVKPRAIVEVTAAMVMMQELDPRALRSDRAFWVQLARRVRALTDLHIGERWDNIRGRVRRCYRELNPRAAVVLGRWLAETLGVGGLHIARLHLAERQKQAEERQQLHDALARLV
ncbi:MAG TPA: hypothetical protein VH913_25810 [Hyphomicrobiaceae bacterium]|jgi:hypothetical protein